MKNLKLLNRINFSIFIIFLFALNANAEEKPVDIWNIEKKELEQNSIDKIDVSKDENLKKSSQSDIIKIQIQDRNEIILEDKKLSSQDMEIVGLYDPEEFDLDIYMWLNSDGDQLKNIFSKINKMRLSKDATELMNISVLTNAYYPKKNISEEEFIEFKSNWLIKNADLDLIKDYLIKNQVLDIHAKLTKYLVDQYLSLGNIEKACQIFSENLRPINNEYLSKFNIYCLIENNKKDEAQILFDLKKELGFKDKYFENKINYLFGYTNKANQTISEKSLLNFHLANQSDPNFKFEPNNNTTKIIWKYLASFNLLNSFQEIEISEIEKISTIEKAVHNKNYPEKDLFELYKRFQFNINQLLNVKDSYKSLTNIEARALIYQKVLLESRMVEKLKLLKILKESFKKEDIGDAFDVELKKFLEEIDPVDIPDNLTSFYYTNIQINKDIKKKIKFNNDVLHQSKLINYFNGDYSTNKIEKDIDSYLKKIKKNKKYFLSKKDVIFLESLKSDGIKIDKKYDDLYEVDNSEIPTDIQVMINNDELGVALLRLVEVIGQDELERIDEDTLYFIISTLNQLKINFLRNKFLLKVLPLKV